MFLSVCQFLIKASVNNYINPRPFLSKTQSTNGIIVAVQTALYDFCSIRCPCVLFFVMKCLQNEMALKLRYGKNEEGNVLYFHSLLHKLFPSNSQLSPPALNQDGIFVNAIVKMDSRVASDRYSATGTQNLAVIYLSWKDRFLSVSS